MPEYASPVSTLFDEDVLALADAKMDEGGMQKAEYGESIPFERRVATAKQIPALHRIAAGWGKA